MYYLGIDIGASSVKMAVVDANGAVLRVLRHRPGRTLLVATHGEDDARLLGAERVNLADVQDGGVSVTGATGIG